MSSPMKVRAQVKGDYADIKILMSHPMETGQRKDPKTNQPYPAHFIQQFTVEVGGKLVVQSETGTAISTNPVFGFKVKGAKAGDKVVVKWQDNKGESRTDEATVS
ncbi:MAG: thiosulfate oxidation carrier complex protein SoxZ [Gammaproteobacteria bacterium]|nr:thiosulfate oxidation carrier complex protein SoxZ [Gammaproteobacteria bacterium]MBU1647057.1 thiosulfate oxidation carrier complex protein SoxZ [Gammaproteobacteria bacterium]MBU1972569.1 thiosulfate oxidation carrier complex protein SoxZ [Gammaproteobacteria bacterium]